MAQLSVINYTGNGGTQSITGAGFQPDMVMTFAAVAGFDSVVKHPDFGSTNSLVDDTTGFITNGITSLDADGFSLGANANCNTNLRTYQAICFQAGSTLIFGTYSGTGSGQTITIGAQPAFILVWQVNDPSPYAWFGNSSGNTWHIYRIDGAVSTGITGATATGFTLGTSSTVNGGGVTYYYLAAIVGSGTALGDYSGTSAAHSEAFDSTLSNAPEVIWEKNSATGGGSGRTGLIAFPQETGTLNYSPSTLVYQDSSDGGAILDATTSTMSLDQNTLGAGAQESNKSGQAYLFVGLCDISDASAPSTPTPSIGGGFGSYETPDSPYSMMKTALDIYKKYTQVQII